MEQHCVDDKHQWSSAEPVEFNALGIDSTDANYNEAHNIPAISVSDLCGIAFIWYPHFDFSKESIPTKVVQVTIHSIC